MNKLTAKNKKTGEIREFNQFNNFYLSYNGLITLSPEQFHSEWEVIEDKDEDCCEDCCQRVVNETPDGDIFQEAYNCRNKECKCHKPTPMNYIDKIIDFDKFWDFFIQKLGDDVQPQVMNELYSYAQQKYSQLEQQTRLSERERIIKWLEKDCKEN